MSPDDDFPASAPPAQWTSPSMLTAAGLVAGALLTRGSWSRVALVLAAGSLAWRSYAKTKPTPPMPEVMESAAPAVAVAEEDETIAELTPELEAFGDVPFMPSVQVVEETPLELAAELPTNVSDPQLADLVAEAFAKVDAQQAVWDADPQVQQFTQKTGPITGRLQPAPVEPGLEAPAIYYPGREVLPPSQFTPLQLASETHLPSSPLITSGNHPLLTHVFAAAEQMPPEQATPASAPLQPLVQTPSAPLMSTAANYTELPPLQTPLVAATSPSSRPLVEPFLVMPDAPLAAEPVSPLFSPPSTPLSGPMAYQLPQPAIEGGFLHMPEQPVSMPTSPVTLVQPVTNALTNLLPRAATPTSLLGEIPAFQPSPQPLAQQVPSAATTELKIRQREPERNGPLNSGVQPLSVFKDNSTPLPQDQPVAAEPATPAEGATESNANPDDETPSGPIKKQWLGWWK